MSKLIPNRPFPIRGQPGAWHMARKPYPCDPFFFEQHGQCIGTGLCNKGDLYWSPTGHDRLPWSPLRVCMTCAVTMMALPRKTPPVRPTRQT